MITTPWQSLRHRWQQVQTAPLDTTCPSPCMSVCIMKTEADECWGCLRSIEEIARWSTHSGQQQRQIWLRIGARIEEHFQKV